MKFFILLIFLIDQPLHGRFITPNPYFASNPEECITSSIGCNLCSYGAKNPIKFIDLTGQKASVSRRIEGRALHINVTFPARLNSVKGVDLKNVKSRIEQALVKDFNKGISSKGWSGKVDLKTKVDIQIGGRQGERHDINIANKVHSRKRSNPAGKVSPGIGGDTILIRKDIINNPVGKKGVQFWNGQILMNLDMSWDYVIQMTKKTTCFYLGII